MLKCNDYVLEGQGNNNLLETRTSLEGAKHKCKEAPIIYDSVQLMFLSLICYSCWLPTEDPNYDRQTLN